MRQVPTPLIYGVDCLKGRNVFPWEGGVRQMRGEDARRQPIECRVGSGENGQSIKEGEGTQKGKGREAVKGESL